MVPCLVTVPVREVLPGRIMLRSPTAAACSRCRWAVTSAASLARVTHGSAAGATRDLSSDCQADGCPPPGGGRDRAGAGARPPGQGDPRLGGRVNPGLELGLPGGRLPAAGGRQELDRDRPVALPVELQRSGLQIVVD